MPPDQPLGRTAKIFKPKSFARPGKFIIKGMALITVKDGFLMGLVAQGTANLTQVRIVRIRLHIFGQLRQIRVALVALEALLVGRALFGKESSMAGPAGDLLEGMRVIHKVGIRPGFEERGHLFDHLLADFHPFSLHPRQVEITVRPDLMAGPAGTRKFSPGEMDQVSGLFE